MKTYKNYFKDHYKYTFSIGDLKNYHDWFCAQYRTIERLIPVPLLNKSPALEIGCGIGGLYQFLKKSGFTDYTGIEPDIQAASFLSKQFREAHIYRKYFETYQTTRKFKTVWAFEVLEHLDDPYKAIGKIYDLLMTDGIFIGTSPYPFKKNVYADKTHRYCLTHDNWVKLFSEVGFKQVNTYPMSFIPYLWRINKRLNIRIPFYISFPSWISTSLIIAKKK